MRVNDGRDLAAMNKPVEADDVHHHLQQQRTGERKALLTSQRLAEEAEMEHSGGR